MSKPTRNTKPTIDNSLPFERDLRGLENRVTEAKGEEREALERELRETRKQVFAGLQSWERVQLARHIERPRMQFYVREIFEDFIELHGDRASGDDPAMVGGIARFNGRTVVLVGQEKGITTEERGKRNFGMAHPEGYRKALRLFKMAERLKLPIITLVDTSGAHPGIEAEARGQGYCIAKNLLEMFSIDTPIYTAVIAEGGSGGALGIAVANYVAMFEHGVYNICAPERCAEILWRDVEQKELAASALKLSAKDLMALGIIDKALEEPNGGAHRDPAGAAKSLSASIAAFLEGCDAGKWTLEQRRAKFRAMGTWEEDAVDAASKG